MRALDVGRRSRWSYLVRMSVKSSQREEVRTVQAVMGRRKVEVVRKSWEGEGAFQ